VFEGRKSARQIILIIRLWAWSLPVTKVTSMDLQYIGSGSVSISPVIKSVLLALKIYEKGSKSPTILLIDLKLQNKKKPFQGQN